MTDFAIAGLLIGIVLLASRLLKAVKKLVLLTLVLVLDVLLVALKAVGWMLGLKPPHGAARML